MKTPTKLLALPLALAIVVFPTHAIAATTDEVSEVLFEETTELLGIEVSDANLIDSLLEDIEYAIDEEIVIPEIVDEIGEAIDGGRESDLDDLLDENSEEQEQSWLEKSPELLNAFDLVKYEFHQCRIQSAGGASECARGLGFKLQVASVEMALADLEDQRATLEGLEGEALEEALSRIAAEEQELAKKLLRAQEKLNRLGEGAEGSAELQSALSEARDSGLAPENTSIQGEQKDSAQTNQEKTNQGNQEKTNQGNQEKTNKSNKEKNNKGRGGND
jgi:hypothetical protein